MKFSTVGATGAVGGGLGGPVLVKIRCPICLQRGTFEAFTNVNDLAIPNENSTAALRRCPDPSCNALVFVVYKSSQLVASYPAERIDFDATNVPTQVRAALEESITCHANQSYTSAAIMVRKALEELCRDKGATGSNLKERIAALGTKVILPADLLQGLDDLRLLGNDAAHIESTVYNQIGQEEVEVGIEFAKEVLKAVYQYSALLKKLQALKKVSP